MSVQETYEATQIQQQKIHDEIRDSQPLISDLLPLSVMEQEFDGHDQYLAKLADLNRKYSKLRKVRGDGNCFFRSFGFAFLESLIQSHDPNMFSRLKQRCLTYKQFLIDQGYSEFTVQDFAEQFMEMIDTINGNDNCSKLEQLFNDQGFSDYYIVFLRLIVSAFLQINCAYYQAFIDDGLNMKQFCERYVEPMYIESDNIHIIALSKALLATINIEVINTDSTSNNTQLLTFTPDPEDYRHPTINQKGEDLSQSATATQQPLPLSAGPAQEVTPSSPHDDLLAQQIYLLYKPGHYDIIYPK